MEPQPDDYGNYCEEPGVRINSVLLNSLGTQWPNNMESDDSEDDDMLPTEEYWAIPDDGWTLVENTHTKSRGVRIGHQTCYGALDDRVNNKRTCYDELDDIVDTTVLSNYQKKVTQITDMTVEVSSDNETVSVNIQPVVNEQPDRLIVIPVDDVEPIVNDQPDRLRVIPILNSDGRDDCFEEDHAGSQGQ